MRSRAEPVSCGRDLLQSRAHALWTLSQGNQAQDRCALDATCAAYVQAMDIDGLLVSAATIDQGGVRTLTDRGELVYDLAALTEALRHR